MERQPRRAPARRAGVVVGAAGASADGASADATKPKGRRAAVAVAVVPEAAVAVAPKAAPTAKKQGVKRGRAGGSPVPVPRDKKSASGGVRGVLLFPGAGGGVDHPSFLHLEAALAPLSVKRLEFQGPTGVPIIMYLGMAVRVSCACWLCVLAVRVGCACWLCVLAVRVGCACWLCGCSLCGCWLCVLAVCVFAVRALAWACGCCCACVRVCVRVCMCVLLLRVRVRYGGRLCTCHFRERCERLQLHHH
jgi:hypothetical protein